MARFHHLQVRLCGFLCCGSGGEKEFLCRLLLIVAVAHLMSLFRVFIVLCHDGKILIRRQALRFIQMIQHSSVVAIFM